MLYRKDMDSSRILDSLAQLNSQHKIDELLPSVLDLCLELTGAERAFLMLGDAGDELSIRAARDHRGQSLAEDEFAGSTTIVRRVLRDLKPLYIHRLSQDTEFDASASIRKQQLKSAICIPLWRNGASQTPRKLLGLLYTDSTADAMELREEHLQALQMLANHVSISIENALLFEELEQKNKKIAELNDQLQDRVDLQAGNLEGMRKLLADTQKELGRVYGIENIVGQSAAMQNVNKILKKVAPTSASVLILGESGTGKELIARYIHYNGSRAAAPMVSINCSAFSDTLLESELFGHRKGAFTGAEENKPGLFDLAHGGTLFLDEVGDMSIEMQKKLLRVLQDGEIRPVGARETHRVDVRIVAATHRNLRDLVRQGKFREDLFFRLNVITIPLPPLRERPEDIPLLVEHFTRRIADELNRPLMPLSPAVIRRFLDQEWPGNVRELENELRRAYILESEYTPSNSEPRSEPVNLPDELTMTAAEKRAILKALETTGGNRTRAAELLGIPRRTFYLKLRKHNL